MLKIGIIQPHFFPWLGFYCLLKEVDILVWLDDVQIADNSYQNRVQVNTPHGLNWINITYKKNLARKDRIFKNLEVSYQENWVEKNLNILKEGYKFTKKFDLIKKVYEDSLKEPNFLTILIKSCLIPAEIMNVLPKKIFFSSSLNLKSKSSERILEIVKFFKADRYITGHGSLNYLNHNSFEANGIKVLYLDYKIENWTQPLNYLKPYVSVLDFLSCEENLNDYKLNYNTIDWKYFTK